MEFLKKFFSNFVELTRAYALPMTLASCFIVYSYAHYSEKFTFLNFLIMTIALCCVNLGANLLDDYLDIKKQTDRGIPLENVTFQSFIPKARLIISKTFSLREVEIIIFVLFLIPSLAGIYFTYVSSFNVMLYVFFGILFTLFYPFSAKYGLSEIIIGLIYGPLMINGGYLALTNEFNLYLFFLSFALFFSTLVLLHTDNLMDWEFDIESGKKTLCILSKTKENSIKILKGIIFASYFVVVLGVLLGCFNPNTLYVFLTLPIATKLPKSLNDYINIKDVKFVPKWYYGCFENWDKIKQMNIEFYMYRFYLGRNFSFFFAILLGLGSMI